MTVEEFKENVNQLPEDVRTEIYDILSDAHLNINHAEIMLMNRGWIGNESDLPNFLPGESLNENLKYLSELFI